MTAENQRGVFGSLKDAGEAVGKLHTAIDLIAGAGANVILNAITTSWTLRTFMISGAFIGAILSYFLTAFRYKGMARSKRANRSVIFFALCLVDIAMAIGILVILTPDVARDYASVEQAREFLLKAPVLLNSLMAILSASATSFLIAGITIISPYLSQRRAGCDQGTV